MSGAPRPDYAAAARGIAQRFAGEDPVALRRFETGLMHFVFEATFARHAPVVLRMTDPAYRKLCIDAARLSRQLRPLGVPLPAMLEDGSKAEIPYAILERLAGSDLGDVVGALSSDRLAAIAGAVTETQAVAARTPSAGRYGYAVDPQAAPHRNWSGVIGDNVRCSRKQIVTAGLFDLAPVERLEARVAECRDALDAIAATPFLHDTTTKNVIVTSEGAFSGIVDVEDFCYGDPRYVVALTLTSLLSRGLPSTYTDHWLRQAGSAQDALFWLYVAVFTVNFMGEHGQMFNGNQRPSDEADRRRLLEQFEQALARST